MLRETSEALVKFSVVAAAIAALFLSACQPPRPQQMTLQTLLDRNAEARGGAQAIESVHAIDLDLEIAEPKFTVTGRYRATRDGKMRIDIFADGERVYTEALGPDGAWQMKRGETTGAPESAAGAAALKRGIAGNLYGLHELRGLGYRLNFTGTQNRAGEDYWVIEKVAPDGLSETLYLDKDAYLVAREIETSALHPDIDSTLARFETLKLDYQDTGGVLFARKSEKRNLDTDEVVQTTLVKAVHINPEIDPAIFKRP